MSEIDSPEKAVTRRKLLGGIGLASAAGLAGCSALWETGDKTRPPEVEGHAYVDLTAIDEDRIALKFNDKWWWVDKQNGTLELIGDDPE